MDSWLREILKFLVSQLARLLRSKLPPAEIAVAERLRAVREQGRFSLAELAVECGFPKSSLANYEYGIAPLPFGIGNRISERLDLNQRWLATGDPPVRPFLDLSAFSVDLATEAAAEKLTFFEAYTGPLKPFLESALSGQPPQQRSAAEEVDRWVRRASNARLESFLCDQCSALRRSAEKLHFLPTIRSVLMELEHRYYRQKAVDAVPTLSELSALEIGKRLKATRKKLGLTFEQAAKKWGVSNKTLQSWEYGKRKPRGLALKQLEAILRTARQSGD